MGFKVKIEGAETIDLSIESVQTVKLITDTPEDSNARSKDVGSTMVIKGKILTAVMEIHLIAQEKWVHGH